MTARLRALCACPFLFLLSPLPAAASHLTISGEAQLQLRREGEAFRLRGEYRIGNSGDEEARNVFPALQIGAWSWSGSPRQIAVGGTEVWTLEETLRLEDLDCVDGDLCAGQDLPSDGEFPLLVHRSYEDHDGRRFSAADVQRLVVGELSSTMLTATRGAGLQPRLSCVGDGQTFTCTVDIHNASPESQRVSVAFFTTKEVDVNTQPSHVDIAPGQTSQVSSTLTNMNGLAGSSYAAFAVLQRREANRRITDYASALFNIHRPHRALWYLGSAGAALICGLVLLYVCVLRSPRSSVPGRTTAFRAGHAWRVNAQKDVAIARRDSRSGEAT